MSDNTTIQSDLLVDEELDFGGTVTGSITVKQDASLHLTGICHGNLLVHHGGHAVISGTVFGNLENQGTVEIWGTIRGNVITTSPHYYQSPDAVIGGTLHRASSA